MTLVLKEIQSVGILLVAIVPTRSCFFFFFFFNGEAMALIFQRFPTVVTHDKHKQGLKESPGISRSWYLSEGLPALRRPRSSLGLHVSLPLHMEV